MTCERSFSTALLARYSCTKPSIVLPSTTASTMLASVHSPTMSGDNRGKDEDQNQRAFELAQQQPQGGGLLLCFNCVQPVLLQTLLSVCWLEAVVGSVQRGEELLGREAPISRRSCLGVLLPSLWRCAGKETGEGFHFIRFLWNSSCYHLPEAAAGSWTRNSLPWLVHEHLRITAQRDKHPKAPCWAVRFTPWLVLPRDDCIASFIMPRCR